MNVKPFYFIILFLFPLSIFSQEEEGEELLMESALWTGMAVDYKINKKLNTDLQQQVRFGDDGELLKFNNSFTRLGLRYRINKRLRFKTNFRYYTNKDYRFDVNFYYKIAKKKSDFSYTFRTRLENHYSKRVGKKETYTGQATQSPNLREKINVSYKLSKKISPNLAYELFVGPNEFKQWRVNRHRLTAGIDWELSKKVDLTTYYRAQFQSAEESQELKHIFGLFLSYSI